MDVAHAVTRLGGVTTRAALRELVTRGALARAVDAGHVVRLGRGRYGLPGAAEVRHAAASVSGVVSHRSAALHHGWAVKTVPALPDVTVPRGRHLRPDDRARVCPHFADLPPTDVAGGVTRRTRTLADCLRTLAFDEALAVADSALRLGSITTDGLRELAGALRGAGAGQARRVAGAASGRAANPFESVLRAISLAVPGLALVPQLPVTAPAFWVQPDLVDPALRLVAEADSFSWHGSRSALRDDARRYCNLVARGWTVLRYSWEDVMFDPDHVRGTLAMTTTLLAGHAEVRDAVPPERRQRDDPDFCMSDGRVS